MTTHRRPRTGPVLIAAVAVLAVGTTPGAAAAAAGARATVEGEAVVQAAETRTLTLVTGDVVTVRTLPGDADHPAISIDPSGPSHGLAMIEHTQDGTSVVPQAAQEALAHDAVDPALFDIDTLIEAGYDDAATDELPLVLENHEAGSFPKTPATTQAAVESRHESIDALGVALDKAHAEMFWTGHDTTAERARARTGKIWLDAPVSVDLADSVPQVRAPQVWDMGFDGQGVTVAVLDTGVDASHPDLAGRISEERNFTDEVDATDHFGHGTHVAATIGGSGTGNGAPGVAPGTTLVSGKVLDDDGNGTITSILEGMEWAASSGADVINMSLGTKVPDDGRGPLSAAVDTLTEQYGSLFVVAAGNSGPNTIGTPASASLALTVGAVDKADTLAGFSSTGPRVGDSAVKPEISAPGVDVLAARAAGTTMGTPADDLYTTASGTSMATPHVAGAAALLQQANPDWTDEQLKAGLVGSATEGSYRVEKGGSGRLDIEHAVDQDAYAQPATLSLGNVRYAQAGSYEPVAGETVLHNDAEHERTFTVTAAVSSASGAAVPEGAVQLEVSEVTVPAGGSVPIPVTVDPNLLTRATLYSGVLVAVATDSSAVVRVPLSVYVEPLLYEITVTALGTDGMPVAGSSFAYVYDENSGARYQAIFYDGVASVRVKPGTYSVESVLVTADAGGEWAQDLAVDVRSEVDATTRDVAWTLDAREASGLGFDTGERATELQGGAVSFRRETTPGSYHDTTLLVPADFKRFGIFPASAPSVGTRDVTVHSTLTAPDLTVAVGRTALDPTPLDGARPYEGKDALRLLEVGDGTAAGYRGKDARDRLVLATVADGVSPAQVIETAAARGAAAVALSNDTPGRLVAEAGSTAVPAFALRGADGQLLRDLAARDERVRVTLSGTPYSPYVYGLVTPFRGAVPADVSHLPLDGAAVVTSRTYARGTTDGSALVSSRRTGNSSYVPTEVPVRLGTVQEWVLSADPRTQYQNGVALGATGLAYFEPAWHSYEPGARETGEWFAAVNNSRINPRISSAFAELRYTTPQLSLGATAFPDGDPAHGTSLAALADAVSVTLFKDGVQVGRSGFATGTFPITDGVAGYEAVMDARRDVAGWEYAPHTITRWTFRAGGEAAWGAHPISMPQVSYDAGVGLDNQVAADRPQTLTVTATPWRDGGPEVTEVRTWASFDDGRTWRELRLTVTGEPSVRTARLPLPRGTKARYVSLRTVATDTNGHTVDQTVDRAFGVRHGR
ncbi:S8 family serine peptidase [Promicromonospora sp. NPDC052451]|uniref:S8 family serine peptidase n=1 Tax=Promicromonospora sp. NPDC052451 TaxID=3364407 RepID=UPI0037CB0EA3